jgi:large subunit ribosomal protein L9
MGDVVNVKDGYARNFLLPRRKALRATKENMARFETERVQLEAVNLVQRDEAQKIADKIEGVNCVLLRQASDTGQLFGSAAGRDIAEQLTEMGFTVERRQVVLARPIKTLGVHEISLVLHPEVSVTVNVNVARSEEEAVRQVDLAKSAAEGELPATDQFFESEEVAEQARADLAEENLEKSAGKDAGADKAETPEETEAKDSAGEAEKDS